MLAINRIKELNSQLHVFVVGMLAISMLMGVRASNVALIVFSAYCLVTGWKTLRTPLQTTQWKILLPAAMYLAYVVGFLWTDDYSNAARELERKLFLLICPIGLYLIHSKFTSTDIRKIFNLFIIACFLLTLICYGNAIANIIRTGSLTVVELTERQYYYFTYLHLTRPVGIEPIYMSLYCNFCIMTLLVVGFKKRLLNISSIVYFSIFVLFVNAKIGLASLVIIIVLYLFSLFKSRSIALLFGAMLAGAIFTMVLNTSFLQDRFKVELEFDFSDGYAGNWNSVSQRIAIWTCAIDATAKTFPFGYGTGDGQHALEESYRKFNYYRGHQDFINAHSEWFQTQLDLGLIGNLILAGILFFPLIQSLKLNNFLLSAFLLSITLYLLVEVVFARRNGVLFFSLFYSLLIIHPKTEKNYK